MSFLITSIIGTNTMLQLLCRKQASRLRSRPFSVDPLGLNWVEPGALARQLAHNYPHPLTAPFDQAVVFTKPVAHLHTFMPRSVIPDQEQAAQTKQRQLLTAPSQKVIRDRTDWTTVHKAKQHLV